jgi:fatty acid-binding protein DegV
LKITNQTLLEKFQSKSAEKKSIKVWLQKVKLIYSCHNPGITTITHSQQPVFNQTLLKKFQSRSAENFSIRVCLKNKNQSLIDPDQNFNRDRDRDYIFPGRV